MTQKHLALETERKFRTNEKAEVKVAVRNIEKLKVRLYTLDLEAFFRKTHTTTGAEALDVALIQPDKTWDVEIEGYAKYQPLEQEIEIPLPEGKPGVCLVNVSEEDFESTTLVIRSDLDLIVRTSRREVLVFAQDMLEDAPAAGVELLLSDGEKVFATGTTGEDGVYRGRFDELRDLGSVRVFATQRRGASRATPSTSAALKFAQGLAPKGYVYTDRPAYRPGQTVHVRGIIRDVKDGAYVASGGRRARPRRDRRPGSPALGAGRRRSRSSGRSPRSWSSTPAPSPGDVRRHGPDEAGARPDVPRHLPGPALPAPEDAARAQRAPRGLLPRRAGRADDPLRVLLGRARHRARHPLLAARRAVLRGAARRRGASRGPLRHDGRRARDD